MCILKIQKNIGYYMLTLRYFFLNVYCLTHKKKLLIVLGATKEIGTALTRMCLRHRAVEARMKTFSR